MVVTVGLGLGRWWGWVLEYRQAGGEKADGGVELGVRVEVG